MPPKFKHIQVPEGGERIIIKDKKLQAPDCAIIPVMEGDGIGPDIMKAARRVVDAAMERAYSGRRKIAWMDIYAGKSAQRIYGEILPEETLAAIKYYVVAIKGPLTTPIGGGFRSINVALRQALDLYACIRPVRYFEGVPSPVKHPEKMNIVIFRENIEDLYVGVEWAKGTKDCLKVIEFLNRKFKIKIRTDSGIGIKPISMRGTKRLVRKAIAYAIANHRRSVTLVHKGNIMKYTEGAFRDWGYKLALTEFRENIVTEDEVYSKYKGKIPRGKIVIKDRIADAMFQQILTRTEDYDILATPNMNGDYLSDACAAQVGGVGMAPGANVGDYMALFEAIHGTAPRYADRDIANPGSLILSAVMMLDYLGWKEAARIIEKALETTIRNRTVTYDFERQMEGATRVSTSEYATHIINNM